MKQIPITKMKIKNKFLFFVCLLFALCASCSQPAKRSFADSRAVAITNTSLPGMAASPTPAPATEKKSAENTAIVISRHANLRDADNSSATVLQTVPQDSVVEVIKQQGAWYYIKTEDNQGWMHGNTLKLQNFSVERTSAPKAPPAPANKSVNTLPAQEEVQTLVEETVDAKIKGNQNSMIYHLPGCASYNRIADKNVVWFKTKEEAEAAGYRIARNC